MKQFLNNMLVKTNFTHIYKDSFVGVSLVLSLICTVLGALYIIFSFKSLPPVVPLYYSLPRSEERLAAKELLYIIPALSLLVLLINTTFSLIFIRKEVVLSRLLSSGAAVVSGLLLYTLIRIVMLV